MRAKEFLSELGYKGNIGIMEMVKFMNIATPEQKALMKQLIQDKKTDEAWQLLQQVTGVKLNEYEQNTDNSKQIFAKLQQLGYKKLGGGQDATVWSKDENSVIKILMPSTHKEEAEKGFLFFYDICKENQSNPHLPKFIDIGGAHHTVFELNGVPYRQIAMERLSPIKSGSFEELLVWNLSDLATIAFIKWKDVLKQLTSPSGWAGAERTRISTNMPALVKNKFQTEPNFEEEIHNLFSTMQDLQLQGKQHGLGWDLHTENIMQRKDGTLVIVDPYFG